MMLRGASAVIDTLYAVSDADCKCNLSDGGKRHGADTLYVEGSDRRLHWTLRRLRLIETASWITMLDHDPDVSFDVDRSGH